MATDSERNAGPEIELSDEDILDAMKQMPGYMDIFVDDFRAIYHYAHQHAVSRLTSGLSAQTLMRQPVSALKPEMQLDQAAKIIVQSGYKGLPVINEDRRVIGILTETDVLRCLQSETVLDFILKMGNEGNVMAQQLNHILVDEAMTTPAVKVEEDAGFREIFNAFRSHEGRLLPVVGHDGKLKGLLLRKDFLIAVHMEQLL